MNENMRKNKSSICRKWNFPVNTENYISLFYKALSERITTIPVNERSNIR